MPRTFVVVKTQFEALHAWPECPFEEVAFLRNPHRHLFFVEVKWETSEDRQLEFFMQKNLVEKFLADNYYQQDMGRKSCETIAEEIALHFGADYVSVFEDNENGSEYYAI